MAVVWQKRQSRRARSSTWVRWLNAMGCAGGPEGPRVSASSPPATSAAPPSKAIPMTLYPRLTSSQLDRGGLSHAPHRDFVPGIARRPSQPVGDNFVLLLSAGGAPGLPGGFGEPPREASKSRERLWPISPQPFQTSESSLIVLSMFDAVDLMQLFPADNPAQPAAARREQDAAPLRFGGRFGRGQARGEGGGGAEIGQRKGRAAKPGFLDEVSPSPMG